MTAILFGSIGSLADTSELQREAFNTAFERHGLDWNWSQEEYRRLLRDSGGERRIAEFGRSCGDDVDAAAIHATKSQIFQGLLREHGIAPRAGVVQTIEAAERDGVPVALVTTTSAENIAALRDALRPEVDVDDFAFVVDSSEVDHSKPAPDAYALALARIGDEAGHAVAIEDNVGGVQAAAAAGIACVAFPGENNADHEFDGAATRVTELDYDQLRGLAGAV